MTFFPNACLLLPLVSRDFVPWQAEPLEEIKPVSGKNLGIGALAMDNKEESPASQGTSGAETAGCGGAHVMSWGRCTPPRILDHGSLTSPGPPGVSGSAAEPTSGIVNPGGVVGGWLCPRPTLSQTSSLFAAACGNKVDPVYDLRSAPRWPRGRRRAAQAAAPTASQNLGDCLLPPSRNPWSQAGQAWSGSERIRRGVRGESRSLRRGLQVPWGTEG